MSLHVSLGHIDAIPDGSARGFDPLQGGRDSVFVVRQGERLHGYYDRCPHEGATPMPYKKDKYLNKRGTRIVCYAHGAQFDIASGECLLGPCKGEYLQAVKLSVAENGEIHTELDQAMSGEHA